MNFAIVGCGFIAKKHALAIQNIKDAKLVAVCDRLPELMEPYVKEYGALPYTRLEELLQDESIDVINICTPSGTHAAIAELAAQHDKHIIVEKPIAMTLNETERIIEAAKQNDGKLAVVHPNRFRPVVMKLQEILEQQLLGTISHALCIVNWNRGQDYYDQASWRGTKEHDGGVLMNQAIHNIDLLLSFMGTPIEVFSMEATRLRKIDAEDVSTGIIRFASGALATVQASTTVYPKNYEESITIFGEKGTVKIGGTNALFFETLDIQEMDETVTDDYINEVKNDPWGTPGHEQIIQDMIFAIQENRQPAVTGEDGRNALDVVLAFYQSAKLNKPVSIQRREDKECQPQKHSQKA
ncbi:MULTISPECIES: Gfo/Idh/MocA family protein [unclassified Sporosarcina]|uniref:Gfo/Idh/MocA family protein n=1 Tax=unclassified Sporosarcina TaxID=2647733 RepID=UPI00203FD987|nr:MULTISPECIES: Gfo/Idh/MocA family oxidoreductase [unclassified Sporosarcina]GKV66232.1 oxidoreductase [Sporosarcina sp. NCCP-2331]GLB56268.1 oxidoreductase [Sporosarcina sp. NCCP-2378]